MTALARSRSESQALAFFCRHLVGLCATFRVMGGDQDQPPVFKAYAGTLIRIGDVVFYLTAGHILREVEEWLASDRVELENAVLADTFGWRRVCDQPVPFDLRSAERFFIDDDDQGLDFGIIRLDPYYVRLLDANGIVALQEENWVRQHTVKFDQYTMLGFPEEFSSTHVDDSGNGVISATMIGVRPVESPPENDRPTRHPRFVGQLNDGLPLRTIRGMSGGPIFGFRFGESETRYWIVALQSSWNQRQGLVYGCRLPLLATILTERLQLAAGSF